MSLVKRISKITVSREAYFVSRFRSDSPRDERRDTSDEFGGRGSTELAEVFPNDERRDTKEF